jgi:hypothetical protein
MTTNEGKNVKLASAVHSSTFIGAETVDNDLLTFGLPLNYLPGMDLPSKRILKTQTTIDIIARSLLDVSNGTYCSAGTEWKNGMRCDVLYTPRLSIQTSLSFILNHL